MADKDWRTTATRRPSSFGGQQQAAPTAPSMSRSRVQIATSYAPGTLITWEGGKGICRSVPIGDDISKSLDTTTINLIYESLEDFVLNWRDRVQKALPNAAPELTIDDPFRDFRTGDVLIERKSFQMTSPDRVGYVPYPLLFRCGTCGSVREYASIAEQYNRPLPRRCHGHEARWTQVDVVYVHWSGNLQPLSPFNFNYDTATGQVRQISYCGCGSQSFKLRNEAPVFSEWRYACEGCGTTRTLKKAEPETLRRLQDEQNAGGRTFEFIEVNMLPVSYRANSTFYPQRANFIEFEDAAVVELMKAERKAHLVRRLADIHAIPFKEPDENEIAAAVTAAGRGQELDDYREMVKLGQRIAAVASEARQVRESWFEAGIVERGKLESAGVLQAVASREEWTRRYDPIRLTVQHDAFVRQHVVQAMAEHAAVDVMAPDLTLSDVVNDPAALANYKGETGDLLSRLGVSRLVLIRNLPICEFSFGYTRVSSSPVYSREHNGRSVDMPVRLKAFDTLPVQGNKRPIYVTQQRNEALYFELDEDRVRRWLVANGVADVPVDGIGRTYIERYQDFGPFLEAFKDRERASGQPRELTTYIYLLLHSLSHQFMHSLADTSGVDRDGIGEHLFPADLAFTIYRRGMTPDLGNVSATWRNHSREFLRRALDQRMLRCGSGSLCDARGGACPACIMVSEVSCIASNLLLSRAALKGGPAPEWEPAGAPPLVGYLDPALP